MPENTCNLFVYGSLRDPIIFESVSGYGFSSGKDTVNDDHLKAKPAFLGKHRRISPDNVYFYAVPDEFGRIEGYVVLDVPQDAMAEIDWYEGRRYIKQSVTVVTGDGPIEALAYLAKPESMKEDFGDRWHVNLIQELWLRKRIGEFIEKKTRPGETGEDADIERIAQRELLGTTERDLIISQYRHDTFSDYYIEQELDKPRPSIKHLHDDEDAQPFINNYLAMVIKQVILNQFEEKINTKYRFRIDHARTSRRYFRRSLSLLAALRTLNAIGEDIIRIANKGIKKMSYKDNDLIDYVMFAVKAAREIFDARVAKNQLDIITAHLQPGLVPLGAEIELSNLSERATFANQESADNIYDSFYYFFDFHLDVLSWKLGGCLDDHTGAIDRKRRRGFLEFAPGRLNIAAELSRPATADPWMLNQLIIHTTRFYGITPHSLHISLQMRRKQFGKQKILPLGFVKCLLAIGGGIEESADGKMLASRITKREMVQKRFGEELNFSSTSKRKWYMGEDQYEMVKDPSHSTSRVYQYKFMRLDRRGNYEPLILCLKGLQIAYNPDDYLTLEQMSQNPRLKREYTMLKKWSENLTPIGAQTQRRFLNTVYEGLMTEAHGRPAHKPHYIEWAMKSLTAQLKLFNKILTQKK